MDEDELSLNITPSFKSRKSKGSSSSSSSRSKGRSVAADDKDNSNSKSSSITNDAEEQLDDDEEESNTSAVLFRKSAAGGGGAGGRSKARSSGIGAASSSSRAGSSLPASRSKLSLSFGPSASVEADNEDDDIAARETSRNDAAGSSSSSSRKSALKRAPGISLAGDGTLSQSMSQASLSAGGAGTASGPSYSKDDLAQLKAANAPVSASGSGNANSRYDALTLSKFGHHASSAADMDLDDDADQQQNREVLLPTSSAIASAKARRETARKLGLSGAGASDSISSNSDFVSLDVGFPASSSKRESRLVREEDEIGEGEDDHALYTGAEERVPLGKKGRQALEKQRREEMQGLIAGDGDAEEEGMLQDGEEEEAEWELAQIRRGGGGAASAGAGAGEPQPYRASAIPDPSPLPSLHAVAVRLQATLADARAGKVDSDTLLSQAQREREALDAQEAELRAEVDRVSSKYEWFLDFKEWVEEVAAFLDEKVRVPPCKKRAKRRLMRGEQFPVLEKIEDDNLAVQKERLAMITKRGFEDDSDAVAAFTGAPIPVDLTKLGQEPNGIAVDLDGDEEVDEMGRSRREHTDSLAPDSYSRRTRRSEREKRRLRIHGVPADGQLDVLGYETDDSLLPSDSADLSSASGALSSDLSALFADVQSPEFRDPSLGVRPRFEGWKAAYGEEYANAFGGLAMVGVWEFWARAELADWNPFAVEELKAPKKSLDEYDWHVAMVDFQHKREQEGEVDDTLQGIVATVVIPRLRKLAVEAYDPFSSRATTRALSVVEEITYCLDPSHPRFEVRSPRPSFPLCVY